MKKILILGALISGSALAADLSVKDCLIQEAVPGKDMTGGFFTLENGGKDTVKLVGASVDKITDKVELHEMIEHQFKKGSYHLMFMSIKHFPKAGETYPVELKFDNKETLKCDAKVITVEEAIKHFKLEDEKAGGHDMKADDKKANEHGKTHG